MDQWEKDLRSHNILKGINVMVNSGDLLEKAQVGGFYADTPQNREGGIVGMPYAKKSSGSAAKQNSAVGSGGVKKEISLLRNKIVELRKEGKTVEANKLSAALKEKIKKLS